MCIQLTYAYCGKPLPSYLSRNENPMKSLHPLS